MRLIHLLVSKSLSAFLGAIAFGVAGGLALTATIALVNFALNEALWRQCSSSAIAAGACAIIIGVAGLTYMSANTVSALMQGSLAELRTSLCDRVLQGRLESVEAKGQSTLVALFTDDLTRVAQGASALPVLVVNLSVCIAALIYLGAVHPVLCSVVVVTQLAGLGLTVACFCRFNAAARAAMQQRHKLVANYHLLTDSLKEFKQSGQQRCAFQNELFDPNVRDAMITSQKVNRLGNAMDAIAKACFLMTIAAIFVLAAAVPGLATEAELRSIVVGFIFMAAPLAGAINGAPQLIEAHLALYRIESFDLIAEPVQAAPSGASSTVGMVALIDACFSYSGPGGDGFRCGPLNLTLRRGEILTLSGGNGSGKTTAAKCLAGLYTLDAGMLEVDGCEVHAEALVFCRELFTVVWSDNTHARFYLPTNAGATGAAVWTQLGLDAVAPFASGWVDCSAMSTGQRRRVALAAALMEARPFLILDEWSANQDKEFRELFYIKLLPQLRAAGHGILVISHDAVGVRAADRTVRMADGLVTEGVGTPPPPAAMPLQTT